MAFADTAFGHVVSLTRPNHYWVTVRLLTDFLSSAKLGDWVEGSGEVVGQDDDLFTVRGRRRWMNIVSTNISSAPPMKPRIGDVSIGSTTFGHRP